jgi:hypothetical protein
MVTACASATSSPSGGALQVIVPSTPAHTAPSVPARLTMAEAKVRYDKISAPFNAAVATLNKDAKAGPTWSQFHTDLLNAVSANETWVGEIKGVRWPLKMQPLIDSMLKTEIPDEISCDQKMASAGGLEAAASVFNGDAICRDNPATADKIRTMLGLPPTIS